jgi:transcriptional regulator with XRE-family HTH domain
MAGFSHSARARGDSVSAAVGIRIRIMREALGLSQRDLALPGISAAHISRIEKGTREPSGNALRALAAQLGTTALYLETGNADTPCPHCGRSL